MSGSKVGLTLGKFAPLHRGHQYIIETALREMDHLIVVIYDSPEVTLVPLSVRADWIRRLYPTVEVLEAWDGPSDIGNTPDIRSKQESYILGLLGGRAVTHFYSSEFYGDHMSRALGAFNRQVDPERTTFAVSGTRVREALYEHRAYVDPVVYRDLITSVVFLGAPSTGKTTLAARLAEELHTVWMPEYGREYWETHQIERRLTPEQLVEIAEGHLEREERLLLEARDVLFVDTNAITTFMFAQYYHGSADARLEAMAAAAASRYDLVFLCQDDIPYDDTPDRSGEVCRHIFQKQIVADLVKRKIPFIPVCGILDERVSTVKAVLHRYEKYMNFYEWMCVR